MSMQVTEDDQDALKEHWHLELNHHSPIPLWTQVARELRLRIVQWRLPAGHALPTVQFLAGQFALSRATVRQAYAAMEETGMVRCVPGSGYQVAHGVSAQIVQVLPGTRITAPAADPDVQPDMPWWIVVALKVEPPGEDPLWFDATRTTLIVS